jgi:hypothetical protein
MPPEVDACCGTSRELLPPRISSIVPPFALAQNDINFSDALTQSTDRRRAQIDTLLVVVVLQLPPATLVEHAPAASVTDFNPRLFVLLLLTPLRAKDIGQSFYYSLRNSSSKWCFLIFHKGIFLGNSRESLTFLLILGTYQIKLETNFILHVFFCFFTPLFKESIAKNGSKFFP